MKCKNCGREIPDDNKFCIYCGVNQTAVENKEKITEETNNPVEKQDDISTDDAEKVKKIVTRNKKIAAAVMAVIVIVTVVLRSTYPWLNKDEKHAANLVKRYLSTYKDPDYMELHTNVLMLTMQEKNGDINEYCYFGMGRSNGLKESTTFIVYMYNGKFISVLDSEANKKPADFTSKDDYNAYAMGQYYFNRWQLGATYSEPNKCIQADGEKIAKKIGVKGKISDFPKGDPMIIILQ